MPVLIDTSFQRHKEPVVNRPEKRVQALQQRMDFVVTQGAVYLKGQSISRRSGNRFAAGNATNAIWSYF